MTQEQKAKAYDEAIKRAKKLKHDNTCITTIFPELKEDEEDEFEEELRKWIYGVIWNLKYTNAEEAQKGTFALHWLEKQKKKSINNYEIH